MPPLLDLKLRDVKTSAARATDRCPVVGDAVSSRDQGTLRFSWEIRDIEMPLALLSLPSFLSVRKTLVRGPSAGYRLGVSISLTQPLPKGEQAPGLGTAGQTPRKTFAQVVLADGASGM